MGKSRRRKVVSRISMVYLLQNVDKGKGPNKSLAFCGRLIWNPPNSILLFDYKIKFSPKYSSFIFIEIKIHIQITLT